MPQFTVKVAMGSSKKLLAEKLNTFCTLEWAVTDHFVIFLHQGPSHKDLMAAEALTWDDLILLGNLSVVPPDLRLVVRSKSHTKIPPYLFIRASPEQVVRELHTAVITEIGRFLGPLWEGDKPLLDCVTGEQILPDY